jgi:serine/threonine protein kinase
VSQGEAFQTGLRIGKYELTRKLGEGGFGVLFVARDTSLDRELAIKFLHPHHSSNPDVVKRFVQEARSIAKVVHPGIVTVYESGEVWGTGTRADGAAFIIMELLHGETLTQRLKNSGGRLAPATAMEICRQVASALEAAHRQGVVHRDLKPDNIMLVKDLALTLGERAKVLDFGIAKMATATPSGATQAGMVFGTPNYMAPEQCKSAADANHSSDIYSLGCILFELVTGQTPFEGGMAELIAHHILTPPPIPSRIVQGLPPHIDDVLFAMLAKEPHHRPATMTVVEAILEERRLVPVKNPSAGARTRTLGGARLATSPPPMTGQPMQPGTRPIPGMILAGSNRDGTPTPVPMMVAPSQTPAVGSPTTLSSAAGIAAKLERKSSGKWWIAVPIVVVAAI